MSVQQNAFITEVVGGTSGVELIQLPAMFSIEMVDERRRCDVLIRRTTDVEESSADGGGISATAFVVLRQDGETCGQRQEFGVGRHIGVLAPHDQAQQANAEGKQEAIPARQDRAHTYSRGHRTVGRSALGQHHHEDRYQDDRQQSRDAELRRDKNPLPRNRQKERALHRHCHTADPLSATTLGHEQPGQQRREGEESQDQRRLHCSPTPTAGSEQGCQITTVSVVTIVATEFRSMNFASSGCTTVL